MARLVHFSRAFRTVLHSSMLLDSVDAPCFLSFSHAVELMTSTIIIT